MGDADAGAVRCCGTDRPLFKAAAAIWADILQARLHAIPAKGAFVSADHRLCTVRRQVLVAILAIGSKLEHLNCPLV